MKPITPSQETPKPEETMRVLKIGTCPTLSGKSTLTYNVGCDDKSEIYLRIQGNSGGGFYSPEWVSLKAIQKVIEKAPHVSSFGLKVLFKGKSANNSGFLAAILKHLGLIKLKGDKERVYERVDPAAFIAETRKLMDTKPNPQANAKPDKAVPKKTESTSK